MIGVFVGPRCESRDVDDPIALKPIVSRTQQSLQSGNVRSRFLIRVIHARFIVPHIEIKEQTPVSNDVIMIGQRVVLWRRCVPALQPECVQVIPHALRIGFARLSSNVQSAKVSVAFGAAGEECRARNYSCSGKQGRRRPGASEL